MIASGELDVSGARDLLGHVEAATNVDVEIACAVHDQGRHSNGWKDRTNVDLAVHSQERHRGPWTGRNTQVAREPIPQARVVRSARREDVELGGTAPLTLDVGDVRLTFACARSPWVVGRPQAARVGPIEDKRPRALRIRGGEESAH